jgi:DNA (cytosine-5)-methyltransferase 1
MLNTLQKNSHRQEFFFKEVVLSSQNWIEKKLKHPQNKIRLATMFSGIGAIECALKRLKLPNEIVFASDNDKFVKVA